jgi:hypothetical protein
MSKPTSLRVLFDLQFNNYLNITHIPIWAFIIVYHSLDTIGIKCN